MEPVPVSAPFGEIRPERRRSAAMAKKKLPLTTNAGAPVVDNQNVMTSGPRGPALLQDVWFLEKLANFDREVIPERRMHAKGSGACGTFTVTKDITRYTKAAIFSKVGKQTGSVVRFSTVAGERARGYSIGGAHPRPEGERRWAKTAGAR
jgi:catalase